MKKIFQLKLKKWQTLFSMSFALTLIIISCNDDFLEVGATGSLGEPQLTTTKGIDGVLIGAYSALNGVFGDRFEGPNHWVTGSITGGEANKGTDPGDFVSINRLQRYDFDIGSGNLNNLWRGRFEGVARSNKVLKLISISESISEADAKKFSAEARLLRGHY